MDLCSSRPKLAREGLAMKQRLLGEENDDVAISLNTVGGILVREGKSAEAGAALSPLDRSAPDVDGRITGLAKAINNLAVLLANEGRLGEAEALHRESLAMRRKL